MPSFQDLINMKSEGGYFTLWVLRQTDGGTLRTEWFYKTRTGYDILIK